MQARDSYKRNSSEAAHQAKPLTLLSSFSPFRGHSNMWGSAFLPQSHRPDFAFLFTGTAPPLNLKTRQDTLKRH